MPQPRLTVYVLIDLSGSMAGSPVMSLSHDLRLLHGRMLADQPISERVDLCLIGFGSEAHVIFPSASVNVVEFPSDFEAGGATATAAAMELMSAERSRSPGAHATARMAPVALLISDGVATDDFDAALGRLEAQPWSARVAWGFPSADEAQLGRFVGGKVDRSSHLSLMGRGATDHIVRFCDMVGGLLRDESSGDGIDAAPRKARPVAPSGGMSSEAGDNATNTK
jgi:uncharacterized protein YegL